MNWFINLWNWLYGSKTLIGAVLLSLAALVPPGIVVLGLFDLQSGLLWLGGILAGVGLTHRLVRSNTLPESPK